MKYFGSKSRIAKQIIPIIQEYIDKGNFDTYIEPFCGGANVIDKIDCKNKIGYDLNKYLIALLNYVKDGGELYSSVDKDLYDKARTAFYNDDNSTFTDWQIGNIGFLASYNGRFYDGGYAKPVYEKTKKGTRYRDYYKEGKDNLLNQAPDLKDVKFINKDYKDIILPDDCLVYCDPPYKNTKKFYIDKNFDYDAFWNKIREWSKDHIVLVSEQEAPNDFVSIWEKDVNRSINVNNKFSATENMFIHKSLT
jgi:DNA adenine methylase